MKRLFLVLLLVLPFTVRADYAADKSVCSAHSKNLSLFAEYRDESMPRGTLIDKILGLAAVNAWSSDTTLLMIYQIQYSYAHPEISPADMKLQAYTDCMKRRGHTTT